MVQGDPAGWESLGVNDPTRYQATFTYARAQGSGQVNQRVKVITNRSNGNYDVYTTAFGTGDQLIYSYNTSNNNTTVSNQGIYDQIFTGPRSNQLNNLNSGVRKATLKLAENNVSGGPESISSKDLQQLKKSQGYKSLANTAPAPAPAPPGPGATEPGQNPDPNFNLSTIQVGSSKPNEKFEKILKYPLYESRGYDYLKINILEYVPSGIPQLSNANLGIPDVKERKISILGTIFLPMQPGISDSASSSWNEDRLSPVQAAVGSFAANTINSLGGTNFDQFINNIKGSASGLKQIIDQNPTLGQFIDNYFAQQIVGSNLIARSTGAVVNPNLELLFNGPKMRTFNYNYRFTPRDDEEAKEVRSIIKVLKKNSLPKKDPNGLFLKTPNVFKLKYVFGKNGKEEEHPYLNKIKVCALTDMNVNYTPDGSYSTYNDGSMTSYTVSLSFSELNPIYYDDFDDKSIDTPTMGY